MLEDLGENRTFQALDDALRVADSRPIHAWTEMRNLTSMKQPTDETVEAWGTRVTRASRRAYPETPAARVEEYAVLYFLSGIAEADGKAGVSSHPWVHDHVSGSRSLSSSAFTLRTALKEG